jgi:hypothetical protein
LRAICHVVRLRLEAAILLVNLSQGGDSPVYLDQREHGNTEIKYVKDQSLFDVYLVYLFPTPAQLQEVVVDLEQAEEDVIDEDAGCIEEKEDRNDEIDEL